MQDIKMNLVEETSREIESLSELKEQLVAVLEKMNRIRPVQFLDLKSSYIYNFLGLLNRQEDNRIFICISGEHDNLPAHKEAPMCNSCGRKIEPCDVVGLL